MTSANNTPVVFLLQARGEPEMEAQEQGCFLERCRLAPEQLISRNVLHDTINRDLLDGIDAFMIGGAGAYSATQTYDWTPAALDLIQQAAEIGMPTFGSCWGHQMIARALGGTVEHDPTRAEMGCHKIRLTNAGQADQLFRGFPKSFLANMGHHDRVTMLPPGAVEMAMNDSQPNQAFRMEGLPIYGTQFHSELDARRERDRLHAYREHYLAELPDEDAFLAAVNSLRETTEVDHLLADFLKTFVTGEA
ncbi:MAG: GMP synthase (glutamine-hydrolyzing) [Rhodothermales bacterium]|jgi:GMP synthase (glutamine-hydrolysing)